MPIRWILMPVRLRFGPSLMKKKIHSWIPFFNLGILSSRATYFARKKFINYLDIPTGDLFLRTLLLRTYFRALQKCYQFFNHCFSVFVAYPKFLLWLLKAVYQLWDPWLSKKINMNPTDHNWSSDHTSHPTGPTLWGIQFWHLGSRVCKRFLRLNEKCKWSPHPGVIIWVKSQP